MSRSREEIAAELDMDVERVLDLMSWGRDHVSLDTPVDDDGDTSLGDLVAKETTPGPDSAFLDVESRRRLDDLVELLDPRSADVIRSRYGLVDGRQEKLADIGARHGVSRPSGFASSSGRPWRSCASWPTPTWLPERSAASPTRAGAASSRSHTDRLRAAAAPTSRR